MLQKKASREKYFLKKDLFKILPKFSLTRDISTLSEIWEWKKGRDVMPIESQYVLNDRGGNWRGEITIFDPSHNNILEVFLHQSANPRTSLTLCKALKNMSALTGEVQGKCLFGMNTWIRKPQHTLLHQCRCIFFFKTENHFCVRKSWRLKREGTTTSIQNGFIQDGFNNCCPRKTFLGRIYVFHPIAPSGRPSFLSPISAYGSRAVD